MINPSFNLSDLDGSNGFVINGIGVEDNSGISVSGAGDINGDGIDDLIIGAPFANHFGERYVVFGSDTGFSSSLELSSLDGSNGFAIASGGLMRGAGDINGDGIDDLIIGAPGTYPGGSSSWESHVVFGSDAGFSSSFELSSLDGSNGFTIDSVDANEHFGFSVSGAGDINGDGIDDLIIGIPITDANSSFSGKSYVVFGSDAGFSSSLELSSLDGSNGFAIEGIDAGDHPGISVSGAGDINGDGIDDLIIGAHEVNANGSRSGKSYVMFGSDADFSSSLELSSLDGSNGFVINGIDAGDFSGISVSDAGDINGDGIDDLIIGAYGADPNGFWSGESYVVFGSDAGFSSSFDLSSLDGSNGFVINGIDEFDRSGISVSGAGDINDDGIDDLMIGAPWASGYSGESYVVYGSDTGFSSSLELSSLDGRNGFVINGFVSFDYSGSSVSDAGDINGDGIDDLIIGAHGADPNGSRSGASYVVFGFNPPLTPVDDAISTDEDTLVSGNVLANDIEPDGEPITVTAVNGNTANVGTEITLASGALLTLNSDGTFDYNPNNRFESLDEEETATDSFSYTVTNGTETDTATVTVTIEGVTDSSPNQSELDLENLDGSNGFVIKGIDRSDQSGWSVSGVGDINGDGIDDLIIGANGAAPNSSNSGESYVVFGSDASFSRSLELSSLDGSNGFVINGIDEFDRSGFSVSGAGDINGDGIDDLIIGAPLTDANGSNSGESYVVFGSDAGFSSSLELSSLDGSNGFAIKGIDFRDKFGSSVSGVGDINGDGIDDLIIGAPEASSYSGESYVVFGSDASFSSSLELSSLDGSNGFAIEGIDFGDEFGSSVSGAGDINGDGIDDLIIGAPEADPDGISSGSSYVVFGSDAGFSSSLELSSLDGSNGFVINGINRGDEFGSSVSGAGDINGDGIDDLIIGAPEADPNSHNSGSSYVVFGSDAGFSSSLELSSLDGNNGFVINGIALGDRSGHSVSGAGDIDGDGIDDLIIGAPNARTNGSSLGESYIVFGSDAGFSGSLELWSLDGSNGLVINGISRLGRFGHSVSGAGDINNDGISDLLISAPYARSNGSFSGESYVVFGSANPAPTAADDRDSTIDGTTPTPILSTELEIDFSSLTGDHSLTSEVFVSLDANDELNATSDDALSGTDLVELPLSGGENFAAGTDAIALAEQLGFGNLFVARNSIFDRSTLEGVDTTMLTAADLTTVAI
jgi:VCBS repeat-containing protein